MVQHADIDHTGLPGIGGGGAISYLGKNAVGASTEAATSARMYMKQITPGADGVLLSIGAYVQQNTTGESANPSYRALLWNDASGVPRDLLAFAGTSDEQVLLDTVNGAGGRNARWLHLPIGYELEASTDYWIGFVFTSSSGAAVDLKYDAGSDRIVAQVVGWQDIGWNAASTDSTRDYSIRGLFLS